MVEDININAADVAYVMQVSINGKAHKLSFCCFMQSAFHVMGNGNDLICL